MAKSSKAQQRKFAQSADENQKAIVQIIRELSRSQGIDRTWSDWIEMGAIALANSVDRRMFDKREKRYMEIVSRYSKEELQRFAEAFAHLVQCWDQRVATGEFGDVLGSTFMMLDMGNAGTGQFFTPYEVSRLMGAMIMGEGPGLADRVEQRGFVRMMEPACGAGGMIISGAHALHDAQVNYQQAIHVVAIDIDLRCVHMTYLQLALLHIPAVVVHGNALTVQELDHWYTPAHVIGGWDARLRQADAVDGARQLLAEQSQVQSPIETVPNVPAHPPDDTSSLPAQVLPKIARSAAAAGQMTLF